MKWVVRLATLAGLAATSTVSAFVAPPPGAVLPGFDARAGTPSPAFSGDTLAATRESLEASLGVALQLTVDPVRGVPKSILPVDPAQRLTPASSDDAAVIARRFLAAHRDVYGLSAEEVAALTLDSRYETRDRGWTHLWFQQEIDGVKVFAGRIGVNIDRDGRIMNVNAGPYVAGLSGGARPSLAAGMAVILAARYIDQPFAPGEPPVPIEETDTSARFARGPFGQEITADLVYFPTRDGARLGWYVVLDSGLYPAMYEQIIDAASGDLLLRGNLTQYLKTAQAYPIDPERTPRQSFDLSPAAHPNSPLGWVTATSQVTVSNNVFAREDPGPPQNPDCSGTAQGPSFNDVPPSTSQDFNYLIDLTKAPDTYVPAAITNLFVLNNIYHDYLYSLGFTEAAGNFQKDNRGQGGNGNDPVDGQAQDKRGCGAADNANFSTPADGGSGRMQMYIWDFTVPNRDGDLDADIVFHEHSHGLSNRLVGGPSCVGSCALGNGNNQGNAMGEGWGDYFSGTMTDDHRLGEYSSGTAFGIRSVPLGSSPYSYGDVGQIFAANTCEVHADGEAWSTTLWDMRDNFIARYGKATGVTKSDQYVVDGMKMTAFPPSFLDVRDAMVMAAGSNTEDRCVIQKAFAKRGMGTAATNPAGNGCPATNPVTEDFNLPAGCTCVAPAAVASVTVTASGPNELTVSWPTVAGAAAYIIERADETTCSGSSVVYNRVGVVEAPGLSYVDRLALQGGYSYAYRVFTEGPDGTSCLATPVCKELAATGNCTYPPTFSGIQDATPTTGCGVQLSWGAATTGCPLAPAITYSIYRSNSLPVPLTTPHANTATTSFSESGLSGVPYYYVVVAEDATTGNGGPKNGGNVDTSHSFITVVPGDRTSTVATYDFEAATDEGWAGATQTCGSGTATGTWQRVDPIGTVQIGQAQPEDDHTPGAGTRCWVTQNCPAPGCGVGAADIDASTQLLTTPAFDCAGASACFVSYWLWYYYSVSVPGATGQVEVSSDDGLNWRPLENVESDRALGTITNNWNRWEYDLATVTGLSLTSTMRLRFSASDCVATIVEMAVDDFKVEKGQACTGCNPGMSTLLPNRLFGVKVPPDKATWILTSLMPAGTWNLHATTDPTKVGSLYNDPASKVATTTTKLVDDTGSLPFGYYQAYGTDNCTGLSVP